MSFPCSLLLPIVVSSSKLICCHLCSYPMTCGCHFDSHRVPCPSNCTSTVPNFHKVLPASHKVLLGFVRGPRAQRSPHAFTQSLRGTVFWPYIWALAQCVLLRPIPTSKAPRALKSFRYLPKSNPLFTQILLKSEIAFVFEIKSQIFQRLSVCSS